MTGAPARPKVVFAIQTLRAGGAERVFATLLSHIDCDRFDVTLSIFDDRDAVFAETIPSSVRMVDLEAPRIRRGLPRFIRLLRQAQPDVVVSTLEPLNKALCLSRAWWPKRTKHIARVTHLIDLEFLLRRLQASLLYPAADAIVFQSEHMARAYAQQLGVRWPRSTVIENPVDLAAIRAAAKAPPSPPFDKTKINLVAAGAFEDRKGFDLLLRALARSDPRLALTLLGDGERRDFLARMVASLGLGQRVRLVGVRANPYPYFAGADALVLPSRSEGSPNVVFEAVACGAAIIATPVAGLDVRFGGAPGFWFAGDVSEEGLAGALNAFAASTRTRADPGLIQDQDARKITAAWEELIASVA
jgi:glycosyltransferase involved in cell wall biosynthesis